MLNHFKQRGKRKINISRRAFLKTIAASATSLALSKVAFGEDQTSSIKVVQTNGSSQILSCRYQIGETIADIIRRQFPETIFTNDPRHGIYLKSIPDFEQNNKQFWYILCGQKPTGEISASDDIGYSSGLRTLKSGENIVLINQPPAETNIAGAKYRPDSQLAYIEGIVTAQFDDCFYISNGPSGIRCETTDQLKEGQRIQVFGLLSTKHGERFLKGIKYHTY